MEKRFLELGKRLKILRGNKTQTEFAISIGTTLRSYQHYESGERQPDSNILREISAKYGKSIDWILNGPNEEVGHKSFAEVPRRPAAVLMPVPDLNAPPGIDPAIQAMADIKEIFDSGDPILIPAIQANLHAFKRALLREQQFEQILKENEDLKSRISKLEMLCEDLKIKFEVLLTENQELRAENNKLQDLNGGCAPTNLSPDNAAPTGTEDKET